MKPALIVKSCFAAGIGFGYFWAHTIDAARAKENWAVYFILTLTCWVIYWYVTFKVPGMALPDDDDNKPDRYR